MLARAVSWEPEQSPWAGTPKLLLCTALFLATLAFVRALEGHWPLVTLNVALAGLQLVACAKLVHNRVLHQDFEQRRKAWEAYARGE